MKNRKRYPPSFANINLLGKCNVDCFFCLGKDIEDVLAPHNNIKDHYLGWENFPKFINWCKDSKIKNLYITGQNTDALMYKYLKELIVFLQDTLGFNVGIRTNGYIFEKNLEKNPMLIDTVNLCKASVGVSIHTLNPETNQKIMGTKHIPDWDWILPQIDNLRVSIVFNQYNSMEIFRILNFLIQFENIRYIQIRRVSTDTRKEFHTLDQKLFDDFAKFVKCTASSKVSDLIPFTIKGKFYDADTYIYKGKKEVVIWPTVATSINSYNYFTDGTVSLEYFVVEGYLKNKIGG